MYVCMCVCLPLSPPPQSDLAGYSRESKGWFGSSYPGSDSQCKQFPSVGHPLISNLSVLLYFTCQAGMLLPLTLVGCWDYIRRYTWVFSKLAITASLFFLRELGLWSPLWDIWVAPGASLHTPCRNELWNYRFLHPDKPSKTGLCFGIWHRVRKVWAPDPNIFLFLLLLWGALETHGGCPQVTVPSAVWLSARIISARPRKYCHRRASHFPALVYPCHDLAWHHAKGTKSVAG